MVGDLLERAARATPAAVEACGSGWWLRHTDNDTWWSGAVLAHGPADALDERIETAERFYAAHEVDARFQICPDCPDGLDRSLAERGYLKQSPISLLTSVAGPQAEPQPRPGMTVHANATPVSDWLDVVRATSEPGTDVERETRLLDRVDLPQAYVVVIVGREPVGIGRAVADDGWTGVFTMATTPSARRRGAGCLVLSAIAQWGEANDAPHLYLQVEQSNVAARRLYTAAGFAELAEYHYRRR